MKIDLRFSPPRWIYYAVFAVSGFSGLIYESIWSHYLKLFLGHAALAQSLVLIIFMGGMALGAWVTSRFSDRLKSPILFYVAVEAVIGVSAILFHGVFTGIIDVFYNDLLPSIGNPALGSVLKWLAAALLITPQSFLLGTTFPLMTAGIVRRYPDAPGASISTLYFTNSIGAALGVLASGFLFIAWWGLPGTILTAGMMNILLALFVWVLLKLDVQKTSPPVWSRPQSEEKLQATRLFLLIAALTGAASFIYEIAWIRMLSLVIGSTTHSFELMLSAFITGLALGGLWIRKRIDQISSPVRFLAMVQITMGLMALLTIPLYLQSFEWMADILSTLNRESEKGYSWFTLASHVIALLVMLPATFLAGMTLPLLTHVLVKDGVGEKSIGRVYSANTVGAIAGVLFSMHIGLPFLGVKSLVIVGALVDVALGVFLVARVIENKARFRDYGIIAVTLLAVGYVGMFSRVDTGLLASGVYRFGAASLLVEREMLYYRDGKTSSVGFYLTPEGDGVITTNGKPDATIVMDPSETIRTEDEITMVMAAALPFAYHPDAAIIANIGLGSGLTTHALLANRSVQRVDTIEIEKSMVEGSHYFGELVGRAHSDPRSIIHIDDAKSYFAVNNSQYDIIIAEPSNPWVSGVASLFSSEFYSSVRNYLKDDGLFVQWIQLYEFDDMLLMSILKALDENFDDFVVYNTDSNNALIVSRKTGRLPSPSWDRLLSGGLGAELGRQHLLGRDDLLVRRVADKAMLRSVFAVFPALPNSDYFPFVDLNAGEARFKLASSRLFRQWSQAPLPMVEMLLEEEIDFSRVTRNEFLGKTISVSGARSILEFLRGEPYELATKELGNVTVQQLATLRLVAANCSFKEHAMIWDRAVFDVMTKTLPYLNPTDGAELLMWIGGETCPADTRNAKQNGLLRFYAAIAARDAAALIDAGHSLLASVAADEGLPADYVLTGILLGYLSQGRYQEAVGFVNAEFPQWASPGYGQQLHRQLLLGLARSQGR